MVVRKTLLLASVVLILTNSLYAEDAMPARNLTEAQVEAAGAGTDLAPAQDVRIRFDRADPVYGIGETVGLFVEAARDTYVTIVSVGPDGSVVRLFPNKAQSDGFLRAGQTLQVPDPASGARLQVSGPVGRELLKMFSSPKPLAIFADVDLKGGGMFRSVTGGVDTLSRSLVEARAAGAKIAMENVVLTTVETPVAAAVPETPVAVAPPAAVAKPTKEVVAALTDEAPEKPAKPAQAKPSKAKPSEKKPSAGIPETANRPAAAAKKPKPQAQAAAEPSTMHPSGAQAAPASPHRPLIGQMQSFQTDGGERPSRPTGARPPVQVPAGRPQQAQLPVQTYQLQPAQMQAQLPQGQVQQFQMPQYQMPQAQMPQAQMPQAQMPQMQMPQMQMPQIQMPQIQMPQIQLPGGIQVQMPQIQMPQIELPFGRSAEASATDEFQVAAAAGTGADCKSLLDAFNAAVAARDINKASVGADAIAVDADCGQYQIPAQRRLAALRLATAQERMGAGAPVAEYGPLLLSAEKPQVLWQASATVGQVLFADRRFAEAAAAYERAIEIVKNESRTPKAPSEDDIRGLLDRASQARILAANPTPAKPEGEFVPAGKDHRSGMLGGVYSPTVRGFGVTSVPVPITFEFNQTSFTSVGAEAARELLSAIKEQGADKVVLVGHTDKKGSAGYNQVLSEKRAAAVAEFLRDNGIEATIETAGRGFSEPIRFADITNLTEDDLDALNRRVEWRRE
ncbi:DUF4384 domain-containing protein [Chthonobacter rhizosphaerae]|uniref:DUF4384 domain-containing protein n=1 Tax=Chthonobacter rhizosphaerae TaxID=2735553 RepID=UPI0015EE566D|nr:DUF4384 domain-containing protein [Chthonobacter rhizosphaerae]